MPPEKQNQFARHGLRDRAPAILLDPGEGQVNTRRNSRRGVDVSVVDPDRIRFYEYLRIALSHLAPEFPMSSRASAIEEAGLSQKIRANAHGAEAANRWSEVSEPRGQGRITNQPRAHTANQQHGIHFPFQLLKSPMRHE